MPKFPRKLERKKLPKNSRNVEVRRTYQEEASGAKAECEREGETGRGRRESSSHETLGGAERSHGVCKGAASLQVILEAHSGEPARAEQWRRARHCRWCGAVF